jgi:glycine hydroxymethyltransferase
MSSAALLDYLAQTPPEKINTATVAYLANLTETAKVSPALARSIVQELADQRANLKLIASENYCSLSTQLEGNLLTDKYGRLSAFPFLCGLDNVDNIEDYACERARAQVEHAHVQPHGGADANLVAYWAILAPASPRPSQVGRDESGKLSVADWNTVRAQCATSGCSGSMTIRAAFDARLSAQYVGANVRGPFLRSEPRFGIARL